MSIIRVVVKYAPVYCGLPWILFGATSEAEFWKSRVRIHRKVVLILPAISSLIFQPQTAIYSARQYHDAHAEIQPGPINCKSSNATKYNLFG